MTKKKKFLSIICVLLLGIVVFYSSVSLCASVTAPSTPLYLGITELRTKSAPNMGYAIGGNPLDGNNGTNAARIWNIVPYQNLNGTNIRTDIEGSFYCIKAGVGFRTTNDRPIYNQSINFRERETISNNSFSNINFLAGDNYNKLLAMMDILYIPGMSTEDEKMNLLNNSGVLNYLEEQGLNYKNNIDLLLSDNEIEVVQQLAIWYYTNNEQELYTKFYNDDTYTQFIYYVLEGENTYKSLDDYYKDYDIKEGLYRNQEARILYKYLINYAEQNKQKYESSNGLEVPITLNTKKLNTQNIGENYLVGPINITKNNDISFDINLNIKNESDSEIPEYKILDKDKNVIEKDNFINSLAGQDFYIQIPRTLATTIKVGINLKYMSTNCILYYVGTSNDQQPIILVQKEEKDIPFILDATPEKKSFDLALRNYITKINGTSLNNENSRVPIIDVSALSTQTTAIYKHRKDPVIVETGDVITYKITIYNEGEKAGYATELVNQLPKGLKFKQIVSGNFEKHSYDEDSNKLILARSKENANNLNAYNNEKLESETIEIECIVEQLAEEQNKQILTNIAWILEEYDAEDDIIITNGQEKDRDSEPYTFPEYDVNSLNTENIGYIGNSNKSDLSDKTYYYKGQQDDDDFEKIILLPKSFDLKLVKMITAVNNQIVTDRIENIDVSKLNTINKDGTLITTATYTLNKEPVSVKKGDLIKYTYRIYNEGDINGYAEQITEDIPDGLEFIWSEKEGEELKEDQSLTDEEKNAIEFNQTMLWQYGSDLKTISTKYLSKENEKLDGNNLINAFGSNDGTKTQEDISYKEVSVILKVVSEDTTGTIIRNEACISKSTDSNGNKIKDRDSSADTWKKYEDDEDYDNIKLQSFDLALRKFIIAVSDKTQIDNDEYLKNEDGSYSRAPIVDTSKLNTKDENGKLITTAIYNHTKSPVQVKKDDIIIYMLRVYNEGDIDGYASKIKDCLPTYLEFLDNEFNTKYGWSISEDGRTATTDYLSNSKISKTSILEDGKIVLSYKEVPIMCKISSEAKTGQNIINVADIIEYKDENKEGIRDRDSVSNNVIVPTYDKLSNYKEGQTDKYVRGQEDDDDFENVIIKKFDLSLKKFITNINGEEITSRIPNVDVTKYGKIDEDGNQITTFTYNHTKDPVNVSTGNIVTYTIRVYNEGEVAGYATEITDDIPEGLKFLANNELNKNMGWKMIDQNGIETQDETKAVKVITNYLSKKQEKEENENLLKPYDSNKNISTNEVLNPDYKDVKIAFEVTKVNTSDKIIINSAQISNDSDKKGKEIDDDDSTAGKWNEGEDDQDREYIKLNYFDLALNKLATQAIIIEDGKEKIIQTGNTPEQESETIVKVELDRKKLDNVVVKFKYLIRICNEGDIAGYAKEITDYIPEGLKFFKEDNKGWTDEGNNIISTRLLEDTLLNPGEYKDVEVILTWVNDKDNIGLKVNTAEISEDYNNKKVLDKDSIPDNKVISEDDIDNAEVILSIDTGQVRIYFALGVIILIIVTFGIILIKKYVL